MQIDKLVMIDLILSTNASGKLPTSIDPSSLDLINRKISKSMLPSDNSRYDPAQLRQLAAYQKKLQSLYMTLIERKYQPIIVEQRQLAAKDLEKKIKRLTRDNPDFVRELP